ncbi:hypothetical protein PR202_ga11401 [Eleusine coracana subsp. coracana]|uniref:Uncharacterized protein n=1 Tax=Eleusine coracana subsp. coracana TaxID=191504 RepID=A0AAV5C8Y9_ELECO|nr:hypothetical protein PR202_ga11401 [Eleusine coracana subsp. coracana]
MHFSVSEEDENNEGVLQLLRHSLPLLGKSVQKRDSALDHSPEQSFNSALKLNDVQLQHLQLLLAHNSFLLKCLGTTDHLLELGIVICFNRRSNVDLSINSAISLASDNSFVGRDRLL